MTPDSTFDDHLAKYAGNSLWTSIPIWASFPKKMFEHRMKPRFWQDLAEPFASSERVTIRKGLTAFVNSTREQARRIICAHPPMPNHHTYPKAPITEALIDLRVNYGPDISLDKLKKFGHEIKEEYPNESPRDLLQGQIAMSTGNAPQAQASRTTVGYIFHSPDRLQAVQARLDGFTFSRFAPYKDWIHLISQAKQLWAAFVRILQPQVVTRVAVRYINQINLPLGESGLTFEDYLRTFVTTGIEGDVDLEQFLIRLVMPQHDLAAELILTEALLPAQGTRLPLILDIDLFREEVSFDVQSSDIWDTLEKFRDRKNAYFEGSITDATRSLFE